MSTQVNTPFYLRGLIPEKDLTRAELVLWEQVIRIIEQLYRRTGGGTDVIDEDDSGIELLPRLLDLEGRVSSGDYLTFDDTGFTWDSTTFTFDQDEA